MPKAPLDQSGLRSVYNLRTASTNSSIACSAGASFTAPIRSGRPTRSKKLRGPAPIFD